jgi:hypothetical protein
MALPFSKKKQRENKKAAGLNPRPLLKSGKKIDYFTPGPGRTPTRHARRMRQAGAWRENMGFAKFMGPF